MFLSAGSPLFGRYPSLNFSYRARSVRSFPRITISAPRAPASMVCCSAQNPARRKCTPLVSADVTREAITYALSSGISISDTLICGLGKSNFCSRVMASSFMVSPPLPMTMPGLMA